MMIISMKKHTLLTLASVLILASCTAVNEGTVPETGGLPPPVDTTPLPSEIYVVQLFASSSKRRADQIRDQFVNDGYQAVVSTITGVSGLLHRVQIGAYNNEIEAIQKLNEMRQRYAGTGNTFVNGAVVKTK